MERDVGFQKSFKLEAVVEAAGTPLSISSIKPTPHHNDQSIQASHLEIFRTSINHHSESLNLHVRYARQLATNCLDAQHSNR